MLLLFLLHALTEDLSAIMGVLNENTLSNDQQSDRVQIKFQDLPQDNMNELMLELCQHFLNLYMDTTPKITLQATILREAYQKAFLEKDDIAAPTLEETLKNLNNAPKMLDSTNKTYEEFIERFCAQSGF